MRRLLVAAAAALSGAAASESVKCVEDSRYFQKGVDDNGKAVDWTSCKNWTGYSCATGGWGVTTETDIAYLVRSCPVSCSDGPCAGGDDMGDVYSYDMGYDSSWFDSTTCSCPDEWKGDGECDRLCNTAQCSYDMGDCFHGDTGCHESPTGADYRGNISVTKDGQACQYWESQWPNYHT
jgi:hypothetical protein